MIKYKCRYMYNEWNCIVKCIEKKMEYTVLEFYSQYFNIKMHLGSIDNEFWCFFPECDMFTELLSPIDLYKNKKLEVQKGAKPLSPNIKIIVLL